ncbi:hypothetical protein EZJ19_10325 [Parasulfuritortus cantonensis]|uniref:Lipoprotein n=1 Tax=Parasulfuritortus cantonensis TaxID=2528202 RepID=A0A4R1B843_9PROT|nr:hypothetical protein [Parasulfuritortus cantonensis]TCJ13437.1 hypothetical protein EZJ19_10325 [Parasulfuritortus cantonensis]
MPHRIPRVYFLVAAAVLLAGCADNAIQRKSGSPSERPFTIENLAKTDIDMVCELTQREVVAGLRRLTLKLYRRNPAEHRKAGYDNPERAAAAIFSAMANWETSGVSRVDWAESLRLAFNENYAGDRVHAYMLALTVMVMASYHHHTQFYMTDELSAQSLYNSARNLETAVWKLGHARKADGSLFLLSNATGEEGQNLSFEREFGKLIAEQDLLGLIMEDKNNRAINRVIQNVASFVLLPV